MSYVEQFFLIAVVHLIAVASPGPDFAIILKQSLRYDRRIAIITSLGIASGIILHVTYSLVGIGLLIASDERLFTALKYLAASYFCYLAWHGLRAKKPCAESRKNGRVNTKNTVQRNVQSGVAISHGALPYAPPSTKKAFLTGFLINGLNVKATLFFVSLFTVVIAPSTPFLIKLSYGLYLTIATGAWFIFLSFLLTHARVRFFLQIKGYWLDRIMGVVLLILAIELVLSDFH